MVTRAVGSLVAMNLATCAIFSLPPPNSAEGFQGSASAFHSLATQSPLATTAVVESGIANHHYIHRVVARRRRMFRAITARRNIV